MSTVAKVLCAAVFVWTVSCGLSPAATWQTPVVLSTGGLVSNSARTVADSQGDAVAIWLAQLDGHAVVQAATKPAGTAWSAPISISTTAGDASSPQLAISDSGRATAIWVLSQPGGDVVQAKTWTATSGSWEQARSLSDPGQSASDPQIACDKAGNAAVVWNRSDGANQVIQAAMRTATGGWGDPQTLSATGADAGGASIAVGDGGNAVALWWRGGNGSRSIETAEATVGESWSTASTVAANTAAATPTQLAADAVGGFTALWNASPCGAGSFALRSADKPAGGAWGPVQNITGIAFAFARSRLAVDNAGDAFVVWDNGSGRVAAASRPVGESWSATHVLAEAGAAAPDLAVDSTGSLHAAWQGTSNGVQVVQTSVLTGDAWSADQTLSGTGFDNGPPRIAASSGGELVVIWPETAGSDPKVKVTVLDGNAPSVGPFSLPSSAKAGSATSLSVAASDRWSPVDLSWQLGDGTTASGTSTNHSYSAAGRFRLAVTATDSAGNSATAESALTVGEADQNQPGHTPATPPPTLKEEAKLSKLGVSRRRIPLAVARAAGLGFSFVASSPTKVTFVVQRISGRGANGRSSRRVGSFLVNATQGVNFKRLPKSVARKLRIGKYRVSVNTPGMKAAISVRFTVTNSQRVRRFVKAAC